MPPLLDFAAWLPVLVLDWVLDWPLASVADVFLAAEAVAAGFFRALVVLSVPFSLLVLMALYYYSPVDGTQAKHPPLKQRP